MKSGRQGYADGQKFVEDHFEEMYEKAVEELENCPDPEGDPEEYAEYIGGFAHALIGFIEDQVANL